VGRAPLTRYHRIAWDGAKIEALFVEAHRYPPKQIILDLDATDDLLHGHQEGRFFHGYYDCYCYLPLYIFLRPASAGGKAALRQHRRARRRGQGDGADRRADPHPMAQNAHRAAGRFEVCPRRLGELVRGQWRRFFVRLAKNERLVAEIASELVAAEEKRKASR
jgi:Transposase DDE domain group 1